MPIDWKEIKWLKYKTKNQMGNVCLVFHTFSRNGSSEIQNRSGLNLWHGIHSFTGLNNLPRLENGNQQSEINTRYTNNHAGTFSLAALFL